MEPLSKHGQHRTKPASENLLLIDHDVKLVMGLCYRIAMLDCRRNPTYIHRA